MVQATRQVRLTREGFARLQGALVQEQRRLAEATRILQEQMETSEKLMQSLNETWEEKMQRTQEVQKEREKALEELGITVEKNNVGVHTPKKMPHLVNLVCVTRELSESFTESGHLE